MIIISLGPPYNYCIDIPINIDDTIIDMPQNVNDFNHNDLLSNIDPDIMTIDNQVVNILTARYSTISLEA